jgi:hypothetical protein
MENLRFRGGTAALMTALGMLFGTLEHYAHQIDFSGLSHEEIVAKVSEQINR